MWGKNSWKGSGWVVVVFVTQKNEEMVLGCIFFVCVACICYLIDTRIIFDRDFFSQANVRFKTFSSTHCVVLVIVIEPNYQDKSFVHNSLQKPTNLQQAITRQITKRRQLEN